eukprot:jgi/Botrbrau1/10194/Bobra.116_1s0010.1
MDYDSREKDVATERPRLVLKPRDPDAAARAEAARASGKSSSIFGSAKPREAVLASREGKKEEDILKEDVKKEKVHLRLDKEQEAEKETAEKEIQDTKEELALEEDPEKAEELKAKLKSREDKLADLLAGFEKLVLQKVKAGDVGLRPSERRRIVEEQGQASYGGGARSGSGGLDGHGGSSFGSHNGGGYDLPPPRGQYGARGGHNAGRSSGYDYGSSGGRGGYQEPRDSMGGGSFGGRPGRGGGYLGGEYQGGHTAYGSPGSGGGGRGPRGRSNSGPRGGYDRFAFGAGFGPGGDYDTKDPVEYNSPFTRGGQDRY